MLLLGWSCEMCIEYGSQQVILTEEKQGVIAILQGPCRRAISPQEVSFHSLQDPGFSLQTKASAFRKEPWQVSGPPLMCHSTFYPKEKS